MYYKIVNQLEYIIFIFKLKIPLSRSMISKSVWQTHKLADKIAKDILNKRLYYTNNRRQAVIVLLIGSLGTGKTEFTKGLAKALHIKAKILSPTFLIMRKYNHFYHLDCYRLLPRPEETLKALAIDEVVNNSQNIVVIE